MSKELAGTLGAMAFIYVFGGLFTWIWVSDFPKKEQPGRIVLWPLFGVLWFMSGAVTGLATLKRDAEKAREAAEDADDEEDE